MGKDLPQRPLEAIREKCFDCCGGSWNEVDLCTAEKCPLWIWRHGKNPYKKKTTMTPEQKELARENIRKINERRKAEKEATSRTATENCP